MKKMSINRIAILLLVCLLAVSFAVAQKPKPTPKPPVKPRSIVFAVTDSGKELEPIAYVANGKLVEAPPQNNFKALYYKPKTNYNLVFGGAANGKVSVTRAMDGDCAGNRATGALKSKVKLNNIVMALATNANVSGGSGVRRLPTAAERTEIERLVKAEFTKQKVSAAMQKDLRYQNLTALDIDKDGSAELVGSYWLAPSDKDRRMLFFIADKDASGKYSFGFSEYQHVTPDKVMSGDVKDTDQGIYHELLIDVLDYDGDGRGEIFTLITAFEGNNFHVFRRQGGKWVKTFESYNYHCAY
jgi:hypothetical protein